MVQERGLWGTNYSPEHVWYRRGASEVRNGVRGTVGTREGLLRYGKEWRGTVGTREGLLRYGTGWRARLVHGRGFCGTERGEGHGWYTGGASAVRKGVRGTVGTREGLLRNGKG